jgi:hypothetical protein
MNHYRCYTLIRNNTQAVVVSNTIIFRHHTLSLPALTTEDRITHCLCALTTAIQADRTPTKTDDQLLAIKSLRAIFSTLQHPPDVSSPRLGKLLPKSTTPQAASTRGPTLPRVHIEPTAPATPPPMAAQRIRPPSDDRPIALRTRAQCNALAATLTQRVSFSLPANHCEKDSSNWRTSSSNGYPPKGISNARSLANTEWITVTRHSRQPQPSINQGPQSTKQYSLLAESAPTPTMHYQQACPVLDHDTGRTLEHRQLCKDPKFQQTWDRSYANELGRLCQGIGTAAPGPPSHANHNPTRTLPTANQQCVEGTNTMRPIH